MAAHIQDLSERRPTKIIRLDPETAKSSSPSIQPSIKSLSSLVPGGQVGPEEKTRAPTRFKGIKTDVLLFVKELRSYPKAKQPLAIFSITFLGPFNEETVQIKGNEKFTAHLQDGQIVIKAPLFKKIKKSGETKYDRVPVEGRDPWEMTILPGCTIRCSEFGSPTADGENLSPGNWYLCTVSLFPEHEVDEGKLLQAEAEASALASAYQEEGATATPEGINPPPPLPPFPQEREKTGIFPKLKLEILNKLPKMLAATQGLTGATNTYLFTSMENSLPLNLESLNKVKGVGCTIILRLGSQQAVITKPRLEGEEHQEEQERLYGVPGHYPIVQDLSYVDEWTPQTGPKTYFLVLFIDVLVVQELPRDKTAIYAALREKDKEFRAPILHPETPPTQRFLFVTSKQYVAAGSEKTGNSNLLFKAFSVPHTSKEMSLTVLDSLGSLNCLVRGFTGKSLANEQELRESCFQEKYQFVPEDILVSTPSVKAWCLKVSIQILHLCKNDKELNVETPSDTLLMAASMDAAFAESSNNFIVTNAYKDQVVLTKLSSTHEFGIMPPIKLLQLHAANTYGQVPHTLDQYLDMVYEGKPKEEDIRTKIAANMESKKPPPTLAKEIYHLFLPALYPSGREGDSKERRVPLFIAIANEEEEGIERRCNERLAGMDKFPYYYDLTLAREKVHHHHHHHQEGGGEEEDEVIREELERESPYTALLKTP